VVARRFKSLAGEVRGEAGEETWGDGDEPLMATFAIGDEYPSLTGLQSIEVETQYFAAPQTPRSIASAMVRSRSVRREARSKLTSSGRNLSTLVRPVGERITESALPPEVC
jgi:hypothetical protein